MKNLRKLDAYIDGSLVGTLAIMKDGRVAFQYDRDWLKNGFAISPFDLPLRGEVFIPKNMNCRGLFGIFEDSLPDAWGTLLTDRKLGEMGIDPTQVNVLDRLSLVGDAGAGDIEYIPSASIEESDFTEKSFDEIKEACDALMNGDSSHLDELFTHGGSSGGARPKVYTKYRGEDWIVKFPLSSDGDDAGAVEFEYSEMARRCGIEMSDTKLFPSEICDGYFGTKRFDRKSNGDRVHVATVKALLGLPFDMPSLDYSSLMQLTDILTIHDGDAIRQMFRLACFNVYAHNQDDHSRNFAFIYDKKKGKWNMAPAYDLTYSTTAYNEHTTSVNWKGNPDDSDLIAIAEPFGISKKEAEGIIGKTKDSCNFS